MAEQIFAAKMNGVTRLVRAKSQAAVIKHVAQNTIIVSKPSPEEMFEMGRQGVEIEETSDGPHQAELGEQGTMEGGEA